MREFLSNFPQKEFAAPPPSHLTFTFTKEKIYREKMSSTPMEMDAQLPNGNSVAAAPPSKYGKLAESLKLEHQFLRVPFEHYKKTIRSNHRTVEKEVSAVVCGVSDAADSDLSRDEAVQKLNSLVSRWQGLKRKV